MAIQVRESTYRGDPGWLVCGKLKGSGWPVRIFDHDRDVVDAIAKLYRAAERDEITGVELSRRIDALLSRRERP